MVAATGLNPVIAQLDGSTRVYFIVGDPIAQVKSPAGVTRALQDRGRSAFVMPAHVAPADLPRWLAGISLARNVDGLIVTVPHKFACFGLCSASTDRAAFLRAVNVMRRRKDGSWFGDMFDGLGFVQAMRDLGCNPAGKKALLVGAGGAGTAIAHALVLADVDELSIHDQDDSRRSALAQRLTGMGRCAVTPGSRDPGGYDIVLNATPAGMKAGDALPLDAARLVPTMFVGCVITAPEITPLIAAARAKGCATMTGTHMFERVRDLMTDFLLAS